MPVWIGASAVFFVYIFVLAPLVRGLTRRARVLAVAGSLGGLLITGVAGLTAPGSVLHDWILPPALLLAAYWISGLLFAAPMPRAEALLAAVDRWLEIERVARATPRWLTQILEAAYAGVYLLVPLTLAIDLAFAKGSDPDRFWTVVLVTDFVCFACLPWIQTRPPRALSTDPPWDTVLRRFNLRLLRTASIQMNTFPSGHAAEALVVALLAASAPWPIALSIALAAMLVSAGAVLGRYHYAADAIAGWGVAVGVWMAFA